MVYIQFGTANLQDLICKGENVDGKQKINVIFGMIGTFKNI